MMALRHRLTLLAAATVGVTVVLVSVVAYFVLRNELRTQVDDGLAAQYAQVQRIAREFGPGRALGLRVPTPSAREGGLNGPVQLLTANGNVVFRDDESDVVVPVDASDRAVAGGARRAVLRDVESADGVHLRVLTVQLAGGGAIQLARSLKNVDATLARLRLVLALLCAGGTLLAAFFGRLFGRQVIQPVSELTAAAEHITQTDDLARRIEVRSDDEVGQMAQRFNAMLEALERSRNALDQSVHSQRQLVADASHELRTPVTSLRGNAAFARRHGADAELLADLEADAERLARLVDDLLALERETGAELPADEVDLEAVVATVVDSGAGRSSTGAGDPRGDLGDARVIVTASAPLAVRGRSGPLERALRNLVENACVHGPAGGEVRVALTRRGDEALLAVSDDGPGIPPDQAEAAPRRFWRGPDAAAGGRPGSGLGLAIVAATAERHSGRLEIDGSTVVLALPLVRELSRPVHTVAP